MNQQKKASVCIFAYNFERFIARAIESVLMQRTDFEFEIIIGDDCSPDQTRNICNAYVTKFPNKIKLLKREQKLGMIKNVFSTLKEAKAEYVATLDGDDYWIDPLKLKKQIDFLDKNPEFSLCCHNSLIHYEDFDHPPSLFNTFNQSDIITIDDIIRKWSMATGSMVYRNNCMTFPDWVYNAHSFDVAIQVLLADKGRVKYMRDIMSVYCKTLDSISFNPNYQSDFVHEQHLTLFKEIKKHFAPKYGNILDAKIKITQRQLKKHRRLKKYPFMKYLSPGKYYRFIKRLIIS